MKVFNLIKFRPFANCLILILAMVVFFNSTSVVQAYSSAVLRSLRAGTYWYDPEKGCVSTGSSSLIGTDIEARKSYIWNFLTNTKGLTPPQAAGVMGNFQAESGFRPEAEQTPGAWSDLSGASNHAVGIAQWDGGRRPALINAATSQGKDSKDLGFQLDYLVEEAQNRPVDNTLGKTPPAALGAPDEWEGLKLMQSVQDSTIFWHAEFEVSNDGPARVQNRVNFATDILERFGSGGGSEIGVSPTTSAVTVGQSRGTIVLDPGHSGSDIDNIDQQSGLRDHDYENQPEINDVFEIGRASCRERV